jgi:glycosyltransferase involved in cell wall biosynthesis
MRILMVGSVLEVPGAIPRISRLMREGFESEGCTVDVIHYGQYRPDEPPLEKFFVRSRDALRIVLRMRRPEYDLALVHSGRDVKAMLRELPVVLAAKLYRLPIFYLIHGTPDRWGVNWQERVWRVVFGIVVQNATGVFALSRATQTALQQHYPKVKVWVTRYPFCPPASPEIRPPRDSATIAFVGRVIPDKGIFDLLQAFLSLPGETRLIVCGAGSSLPAARRYAEEMAISDRVDFLGWQDHAGVWRILQRADLLVLPTVREGFPSVLLEAAAAELPIVTTPVGGIPDHFKDGVHAVFVVPGAPAQLATAILELLGDPARRARMGVANRILVRGFAPDRVIPEYMQVFRQMLPLPGTRRSSMARQRAAT